MKSKITRTRAQYIGEGPTEALNLSFIFSYLVYSYWTFTFIFDDAVNITSELHDPNARKSHRCNKKERPNREHQCGAGRIPSEDQVRTILTTLEC